MKATRQHIKEHNTTLVLQTIYQNTDISRAEIARYTGLTRTTVSDIVASLIDDGLVVEVGQGEPSGGKPPIQISLVPDARQILCLDLSSDNLFGTVVNLRGQILHRQYLPLDGRIGQAAMEQVCRLVDLLAGAATASSLGIGIGTPGLVDSTRGIVHQAVNRGWVDLPMRDLVAQHFSGPVYVTNDSQAAALGEHTYGSQRQASNLVVIKVGEGIGSGIVLDGQLFPGDGFSAGEIGHLMVEYDGLPCTCGNYGCLETVLGKRALLAKAQAKARQHPNSLLAQQSGGGQLSMEHLHQAYLLGDPLANELIVQAGAYLGAAIANLIGILNVRNIVISGYPEKFGDTLLQAAMAEARKRVLPAMAVETHLSLSTLGEVDVVLGASALVLREELGLP
jgi:N-acetylglucosamine repressor